MRLGWGERQILAARRLSQLVVPGGELGFAGLLHHERGRELYRVVRAQRVARGQVSGAPYKEYLNRDATPKQGARVARITSIGVKAGALLVVLSLDPQ